MVWQEFNDDSSNALRDARSEYRRALNDYDTAAGSVRPNKAKLKKLATRRREFQNKVREAEECFIEAHQ